MLNTKHIIHKSFYDSSSRRFQNCQPLCDFIQNIKDDRKLVDML